MCEVNQKQKKADKPNTGKLIVSIAFNFNYSATIFGFNEPLLLIGSFLMLRFYMTGKHQVSLRSNNMQIIASMFYLKNFDRNNSILSRRTEVFAKLDFKPLVLTKEKQKFKRMVKITTFNA